jgi:hypothetical protein
MAVRVARSSYLQHLSVPTICLFNLRSRPLFRALLRQSSLEFVNLREMSSLHFQIAENEDEAKVKTAAQNLIDRCGWKLTDGIQLEKKFFFKNHQSSVVGTFFKRHINAKRFQDFFLMISIRTKKEFHHPKIISV